MELLKELKQESKNLFQFYIIVGDGEKNREVVKNFLEEELNLNLKNNFFLKIGDELKIDEARNIKKENSYSNDVGEKYKKIYFLDYKKINLESQNALLKTFEEVGENSHFFLFVPSDEFILETIKSRARILKGEKKIDLD
jgi:DNA polymerase III delta prime subunit